MCKQQSGGVQGVCRHHHRSSGGRSSSSSKGRQALQAAARRHGKAPTCGRAAKAAPAAMQQRDALLALDLGDRGVSRDGPHLAGAVVCGRWGASGSRARRQSRAAAGRLSAGPAGRQRAAGCPPRTRVAPVGHEQGGVQRRIALVQQLVHHIALAGDEERGSGQAAAAWRWQGGGGCSAFWGGQQKTAQLWRVHLRPSQHVESPGAGGGSPPSAKSPGGEEQGGSGRLAGNPPCNPAGDDRALLRGQPAAAASVPAGDLPRRAPRARHRCWDSSSDRSQPFGRDVER